MSVHIPHHHKVVFDALAAASLPHWRWKLFEISDLSVEHPYYKCNIEGYYCPEGKRLVTSKVNVWGSAWSQAVALAIRKASEYEADLTYDPYAEWQKEDTL